MITADHARTSRIALSLLALALVVSGCGDDAPVASVDAAVVIDMPPVDFGTDAFAAPDLGTCRDDDGDGFTAGASPCGSDCDDSDASRYPGADEICDGDDEDCNESTLGPDGDGDGFSSTACCNGLGTCGTDCDDTRATVNDTALETCDGVDNDCDGVVDDGLTPIAYAADCDLDGFGDATAPGMAACTMPVLPPAACAGGEWVLNATDCDDGDASVHRGATDFCGDTVDSDCDPTTAGRPTMWFRDADDDGFYGAPVDEITSCTRPPGHARTPGDCNDADPTTRPGAAERCDNRDNDCDALVDDGADGSCAGVLPNATSVCRAGACVVDTCFSSFGDCNGTAMDGCETNVSSAVVNCGSCGFACAARPSSVATCVASRCEYTCAAGFQDCGASPGCESVSAADAANCGTCGNVCPGAVNASATCAASTCGYACAPGFRDCGASPGCESASATDLANCGSCGNVCSGAMNASTTCTASTCGYTCGAGFGDCDASRLNGCEAAFATDATRCGSCANDCTAAANVVIGMCSASTCVLGPMSCATGFSHCDASVANGCERPTSADVNNCGGCGTVCSGTTNGTPTCAASVCAISCATGYRLSAGACLAIAPPRQLSPMSTATATSRRATFRWSLPTGTDGARLQVCAERACTTIRAELDVTGTSARPVADLPPGTQFWRVYGRAGTRLGLVASPVWQVVVGRRSATLDTSFGATPDFNGDGIGDVAVGAFGAGGTPGRVHVYQGSTLGLPVAPTLSLTGTGGADGYFGYNVRAAGDVNGDGFGDLLVGAQGAFGGQGRAYVYFGSAAGLPATPSVTLTRPTGATGVGFGMGIASLGDANGDGYADVLVGNSGGGSTPPHAHLFLGSASGPSATPTTTIVGPASGTYFSYWMAGGDINGDGLGDAMVSAFQDAGGGRVYVYLGVAGVGLSTAPTTLISPQGSGQFGAYVAHVGDVNGDGYGDFAAGNIQVNPGFTNIYYGGASGLPTTASLILSSPAGPGFGYTMAGAGDVNGDGYGDLMAGNPLYPDAVDWQGRGYVYYGSGSGLASAPSATFANPDGSNANFTTAAGSGDVDGDGFDDVYFGSYVSDRSGRVHVYRGSAIGVSTTRSWLLSGPDGASYYFGISVARAEPERARWLPAEVPAK